MIDETIPQVQGKQPDSKEEYWVALALDRLRIPYIFQFELLEARLRGGITIDFLVMFPFAIPVEIMGEYWHTGQLGSDDKMRQIIIEQIIGHEVINLWTLDLVDPETTYTKVRQALGR